MRTPVTAFSPFLRILATAAGWKLRPWNNLDKAFLGEVQVNPTLGHTTYDSRSSSSPQGCPTSQGFLISGNRVKKVSPTVRGAAGFSMIELAVALVVIAILLGSILVPLNTQVESRNYDETQRILERAREALLGYAAATGRFPCPASLSSNGAEHFLPGGSAADGRCDLSVTGINNVYAGFLPAATLGVTPVDAQGYALDAWGLSPHNRIRYAVSSQTVPNPSLPPFPLNVARPFTTQTNPPSNTLGMRGAGMANISVATLLQVCSSGASPPVVGGSNCGPATNTLTTNAIVVIWSVGPNAATTGGISADESENPNPGPNGVPLNGKNDRVFVSKTRSAGTAGEFDDVVTWIGPPTVFNRLIQAGQLP